jgi:hypoxanthine phosphoribosyltransferase
VSVPFAHASEAEMSRILDFYAVRWEYEPDTFPILWNLDGDVIESFSPDFYLPDLDLYLEMTTLRQKLVRKKNRKLRRLRELYPELNVKLFYARDFRALMLKYGKLALVDGLSGSSGQVPAPHGLALAAETATEVTGSEATAETTGTAIVVPAEPGVADPGAIPAPAAIGARGMTSAGPVSRTATRRRRSNGAGPADRPVAG